MAGCLFVAGVIPSLAVEYSSIDAPGVVVTGAGVVGWGHGTGAWSEGEFFRFHITGAEHR